MEQNSRPDLTNYTGPSGSSSQGANAGHAHSPTDPAFFDRVLDRIDPHRALWDAGLWMTQIICGRWLAWRRMQQGVSIALLAEQINLDPHLLRCLEEGAGLTDVGVVPQRTWTLLAVKLGHEGAETARIEHVIAHALGQIDPPDLELVDGLIAEFPELEDVTAPQQSPVAVASALREQPAPAVRLGSDIFALLGQLIAPRHSIDLADLVKIDGPTVNGLLIKMLNEGWISKVDQRIDPDLDEEILLTYYRTTPLGQNAYRTEQQFRDAEQRTQPGLASAKPAPG